VGRESPAELHWIGSWELLKRPTGFSLAETDVQTIATFEKLAILYPKALSVRGKPAISSYPQRKYTLQR